MNKNKNNFYEDVINKYPSDIQMILMPHEYKLKQNEKL